MENWGVITFIYYILEVRTMQDQAEMYLADLVRNKRTICHEISHMWFGNLVTMKWWDDLWLNEGFARFIEHKVLASIHPEYQLDTLFLKDVFEVMIGRDRPPATHPVIQQCINPEEIDNIFDVISYGKGASLARMAEALMGETKFREGIRAYIRRFEYKNATTEDLWGVLDEFGGSEVSQVMRQWTHLTGHPDVTVLHSGEYVTISQAGCTGGTDLWPIPIHYRTSLGATGKQILKDASTSLHIGTASWVKINLDHTVVMQTLYESEMLRTMANDFSQLGKTDIYGLVLDCFYFFKEGQVHFSALAAVLESAAKHLTDVALCRKVQEILKFLDEELDAANLFPEEFRLLTLGAMRPFLAVPDSDFYVNEVRAIAGSCLALYGKDLQCAEEILKQVNETENPRPEVVVQWVKVVGSYTQALPFPICFTGKLLDLAYNHAGPGVIRQLFRATDSRRLRSNVKPGKVLQVLTADIQREVNEQGTSVHLEKWVDVMTEVLRFVDSAVEFADLRQAINEIAGVLPQCRELVQYAEGLKDYMEQQHFKRMQLLAAVGLVRS